MSYSKCLALLFVVLLAGDRLALKEHSFVGHRICWLCMTSRTSLHVSMFSLMRCLWTTDILSWSERRWTQTGCTVVVVLGLPDRKEQSLSFC